MTPYIERNRVGRMVVGIPVVKEDCRRSQRRSCLHYLPVEPSNNAHPNRPTRKWRKLLSCIWASAVFVPWSKQIVAHRFREVSLR